MENKMYNEIHEILSKLAMLQADINYIKKHVKDEDIFLTEEEEQLLQESYENEKAGRLLSSEEARKELEI